MDVFVAPFCLQSRGAVKCIDAASLEVKSFRREVGSGSVCIFSLRNLTGLCASAVLLWSGNITTEDAKDAEVAQRVETDPLPTKGSLLTRAPQVPYKKKALREYYTVPVRGL